MELRTFAAAAALAAIAALSPASAGEFEFRYKSYELETAGGRADLMARLDRSIERYCDTSAVRSLSARRAAEDCRAAVKAEMTPILGEVAVAKLGL